MYAYKYICIQTARAANGPSTKEEKKLRERGGGGGQTRKWSIVHEANNYLYLNNRTVACSLITNEIVIFNDSAVMVVCLACYCLCFI